jgi:tetratricopeptide (TPR) repeat protein
LPNEKETGLNFAAYIGDGNRRLDRINVLIAAFVTLVTFIIYNLTKAPTLSFWDCGELVASSYILGIPHPPGTPLYVLLGRLFSILPIAADISVRINIFSSLCSAGTALFGYLVAVRLIRFWFNDRENIYNRIIAYIGGITGAFFIAFGSTNWGNSVEAEVYAAAMLLMMLIYWLALKYFDNKETAAGGRFMLMIIYLAMLGIGIHLTMFVIFPVVALYFILKSEVGSKEWAIIALFFFTELYFIFELSSRDGEIPFYLPTLILFIIFLFHSALLHKLTRPLLLTIGLYLIAIYPLYIILATAVSRHFLGADISSSVAGLENLPLGWVGLGGLVLWGLFSIIKYLGEKNTPKDSNVWLMPAVYSLAPAILLGIGKVFDGYISFLMLTVITIVILAAILWHRLNRLILIGVISISLIILGFWQLVWGLVIGTAVIIILGFYYKDKSWKTALAILLLAAIGFSVHIYIPIRSAQNPNIDENKPSRSLASMVGYLERKQYGSESMISRMFVRRGEWENQFGNYQRMGFWRFFRDQYGFAGPRFFIILILGLFGIWETIRRKPDIGLPFWVIVLICSAGLVLYMNFADGTRQDPITGEDYLEVRDRDYFWTPAFILFGLAIGLGIAGIMDLVRDLAKGLKQQAQKYIFGFSCLLVFLPIVPLKVNHFVNDRSKNYMPYDYAYNFLEPLEKDAILFTNGDNDTFPLWCLQEVYGVRRDVRIVNLSLGNTNWYIKQMKDKFGVPISLSDEAIDRMRPYFINDSQVSRIQDQLIDNVIETNKWRYPIYMTVAIPEGSRRFHGRSLEDNYSLEGLVYRLTPKTGRNQIDFDKMSRLYMRDFKFRSIADPTVYKDENVGRVIGNYSQGFLVLADSLRRIKDYNGALEFVRRGLQVLPSSLELYLYAVQLFTEAGRVDTIRTFIDNAPVAEKSRLYYNWGLSARAAGRMDEAVLALELTHQMYPEYVDGYHALVSFYYQNKQYSKLRQTVAEWVKRHPDDSESRQLMLQIQNISPTVDSIEGGH